MITEDDKYFLDLIQRGRIQIDYETGIVYSLINGKLRPVGARMSSGYLHMSAGPSRKERHYILLHRLVWLSTHDDIPDGYEINHKNGHKKDNRYINLECVTRSENTKHAHYVLGKVFGVWALHLKRKR